MRRTFPIAITALLALILACTLPGVAVQNVSDLVPTQLALALTATAMVSGGQPTAAFTAISTQPAATATTGPTPTITPTSAPCNRASFVADVSIPDNTVVDLNAAFTKTWRLRNVGTCTWTSGYRVVFDSGDQMGGPASQQLTTGTVAHDQTIDVSVNLKAPANSGTYKGNWKLREPGGAVFALSTGPFWVQIRAQAPAIGLPDWPTRMSGDTGPEVAALQRLLVAHGESLAVDGNFGAVTKSKVQHFQGQNGLAEDGIVGGLTWQKLIVKVEQGSSGPAVSAVQKLLNDKFGYSLNMDGSFGPSTDAAVVDFQKHHGLGQDGVVGTKTWLVLIGS